MEQELIQLIAKNILLVKSANQLGELNDLLHDHRMKIDGIPLEDTPESMGSRVLDKTLIHDVTTLKILQAQGVYTLSQLLDMGLQKFSSLPNIGKGRVVKLKSDLLSHGIEDFGPVTLDECIDNDLNTVNLIKYGILTHEEIAQLYEYCKWALSYLEANCRLSSFTINSYMNTINYRTLEAYRELSNMLEAKEIRRTEQGKSMFKHIVPILTKLHDPEVLLPINKWWEESIVDKL